MLQEISFTHIHAEESQRVLRREKKGGACKWNENVVRELGKN